MRFPIGSMMGVALACGPSNDGGSEDPTESVADTGDIVATGGDGGSASDETGEPPPGSKLLCSTLESGATLGGEPLNPLGFPPPCDPANQSGGASEYLCCSDDPAAVGGALPAYDGF